MKAWPAPAVIAAALVMVATAAGVGVALGSQSNASPVATAPAGLAAEAVAVEDCPRVLLASPLRPAMGEVVAASLRYVDPADITAVVICPSSAPDLPSWGGPRRAQGAQVHPPAVITAGTPPFEPVLDVLRRYPPAPEVWPAPSEVAPYGNVTCQSMWAWPTVMFVRTMKASYRLYYPQSMCGGNAAPVYRMAPILRAGVHGVPREEFSCAQPETEPARLAADSELIEGGVTALLLCPQNTGAIASGGPQATITYDRTGFPGLVGMFAEYDHVVTLCAIPQQRPHAYVLARATNGGVFELRPPMNRCGKDLEFTEQLDHARGVGPRH